jgi:hypothetical protein
MVLGARWKPWFVLFVLCLATQILASDSDHNDAHTEMTPEEPVDSGSLRAINTLRCELI